jgi:hypothetical protein
MYPGGCTPTAAAIALKVGPLHTHSRSSGCRPRDRQRIARADVWERGVMLLQGGELEPDQCQRLSPIESQCLTNPSG